MSDLKVPIALSATGELTLPQHAVKGLPYHCPGCQVPLTVREGKKNRKHFSHPSALHPGACTGGGESLRHLAAKAQLQENLLGLRNQGTALQVRLHCPSSHPTLLSLPLLPDDQVLLEHRHLDRRLDLAVIRSGEVILGVEVYVEHAVDEPKRQAIAGIPWVELDGYHDLQKNPLTPLHHNFPFNCKTCEEHRKEEERRASALQQLWDRQRQQMEVTPGSFTPTSSRLQRKLAEARARMERQHEQARRFFEGKNQPPGVQLYRDVQAYVRTFGLEDTFTEVKKAMGVRCVWCKEGIVLVAGSPADLLDCLICQQHYTREVLQAMPDHLDHKMLLTGPALEKLNLT